MANSHMGVSNTRVEHKGRLVGSKIRGTLIYRTSRRTLGVIFLQSGSLEGACWYKYQIYDKDYMISNKVKGNTNWRRFKSSPTFT